MDLCCSIGDLLGLLDLLGRGIAEVPSSVVSGLRVSCLYSRSASQVVQSRVLRRVSVPTKQSAN